MSESTITFDNVRLKFFLSEKLDSSDGTVCDIIFITEEDESHYIGKDFYPNAAWERQNAFDKSERDIQTENGILTDLIWPKDIAHEELPLLYKQITIKEAIDLGFPVGYINLKHMLRSYRLNNVDAPKVVT